jgi:GntR family transcriptional regulator/MocR family aminotransferase
MPKSSAFISLGGIALEQTASIPLHRQLYNALGQAILSGRLASGTRLPSSRALAAELAVSRNTVVNAFEQLVAEGYLEGKVGAGTWVSRTLPDELLAVRQAARPPEPRPTGLARAMLSGRGRLIAGTAVSQSPWGQVVRPFRAGLPALDLFPRKVWGRLLTRRVPALSDALLQYGDPAGYRPLRQAIATYLGAARGVRCEADQVLVVGGAQQALDLTARLLLDPGQAVWVENPGYLGARGAFLAAGASLVPLPVDDEGLNVAAGLAAGPQARLAYISPSHQYPLGVTMSLPRRLELLAWAEQNRAWIVEDDYDSEYRYAGQPLAALQGLDPAGRVIYIGTFSKVLFPALRLGYLVAAPALIQAFVAARALQDRGSALLEQAVLADFIDQGHFARHIRRMRTLYRERQTALVEAVRQELGDLLEIKATPAGLHLVGWLPAGVDDQAVSQRLLAEGIESLSLSSFALTPLPRGGLVLGYAPHPVEQIRAGVGRMATVLKKLVKV